MATIRYLKYIILLILTINLVIAAPPDLPVLIYGKVTYSSGDPAPSVLVTATWEGGSATTKTLKSGEYSFLEKEMGSKVTLTSQGTSINLEPKIGIMNHAPEIIIEESGFFSRIFNSIASFLIPESELAGPELEEYLQSEKTENIDDKKEVEEESTEKQEEIEDKDKGEDQGAVSLVQEDQETPIDRESTRDNFSPVLGYIDDKIYVCEGTSLYYPFNVTNPDSDTTKINITPERFFRVSPDSIIGRKVVSARLYTQELGKKDVGEYKETIVVSDGELIDTKTITIEIIEINNPPTFYLPSIKTISLVDEGKFYYNLSIRDVESEVTLTSNFKKGKNIFNITGGNINIPLDEGLIGVYHVEVCGTDEDIDKISPNIEICNQDGKSVSICKDLSLTITNENKQPLFVSNYPRETEIILEESEELEFSLTLSDPDGTFPDVYWYVNNNLEKMGSGFNGLEHTLSQSFPCGSSNIVRAEITDGSLNNSIEWDIITQKCEKEELSLLRVVKGYIKVPSFLKKILKLKIIIPILIILVTLFIVIKVFKVFNLRKEWKK